MPFSHSEETIHAGLMELVTNGGNVTAAARTIGVKRDTLADWRSKTHAAKYAEMREKYLAEVEEKIVTQAFQTALLAQDIERELLEKNRKAGPREAPQALRAVVDSKAKNIDKALTLMGRPSRITQERGVEDILENLMKRGVLKQQEEPGTVVEGTVTRDA